jgi:pyrimidine operon attenuation protein/uracil phosphoribosyltransferase
MSLLRDFLGYTVFSSLQKESSSWGRISYSSKVNEGIRLTGEGDDKNIVVDFDQDEDNDVVSLNPPVPISKVRKKGGETVAEMIPVFRGYKLNRRSSDLREFMELVKRWGALNPEDLRQLISLTYPEELKNQQVNLIFITGSSDPLAAQIAEAIKEMYHPRCKIIDIMKRYYGADVNDIVNWEAYANADETTREMIDTFINNFRRVNGRPPRREFEGYIKKSAGLQSGARNLLNPGHTIDSYIMNNIVKAELDWEKDYGKGSGMPINVAIKNRPSYLFVDDTIIGGTTIRGIFKEMMSAIHSNEIANDTTKSMIKRSIFGYCLFSYGDN